jgi:hypothetical protein
MHNIIYVPSFYSHILNATLLMIAVVILYKNYTVISSKPYQLVMVTLVASIAVGIHGLSHLGLEEIYNFNPMKNVINSIL